MEIFWFCAVAMMVALYVIFDGFDIGAGIVHLLVGRTEKERGVVLSTIGPVWDGNEVWLLASGGVLYFAFPALYASSFSGFYLPLTIVLWLLILRGCAIEFRHHLEGEIWKPFWDVVFAGSSALLAIFFGAALGNVVRGVPLDSSGYFFLPLWTNFDVTGEVGILDWYTISVGVAAFVALSVHGAHWVVLKTDGEIRKRALALANRSWFALVAMSILVTVLSFRVQPHLAQSFERMPWAYVFPVLALTGLFCMRYFKGELDRFLASCVYIAGMLTSAAAGVFPNVLPSHLDPARSLTVYNAKAADYGLQVGLYWWIPGILLVAGYFVFTYRNFAGKVSADDH
jgi:cytochrome d ubiquinol oxidase subunit II